MKNNLICTIGTSLFRPNLLNLPTEQSYEVWLTNYLKNNKNDGPHLQRELILELNNNFYHNNWRGIASCLLRLPGWIRLNGAEINSITDLIGRGYCQERSTLLFCHSDTEEGRQVAEILRHYYELQNYPVVLYGIPDLQDADPKRFRTKGLRNLAKVVCRIIRERGAPYCAINATGGYKAQIAIGVLMGQALEVPVYYKHELFSEIIAFPPMPISLDHALWMRHSGLLAALDRHDVLREAELDIEDWDERLETLVERVPIDGDTYLEISPTGQIFHETFQGRFESDRDQFLPPSVPAAQKAKPTLNDHSWGSARGPIVVFMQRLIEECPYVQACRTHYWHPSLSRATLFRLKGEEIEGVFSNGSWTVKIIVETSATTAGQREACVAALNDRIGSWKL